MYQWNVLYRNQNPDLVKNAKPEQSETVAQYNVSLR